jgi:hypothetical protein
MAVGSRENGSGFSTAQAFTCRSAVSIPVNQSHVIEGREKKEGMVKL